MSISQQTHRTIIYFYDVLLPRGIDNSLQGAELQTPKQGGDLVNPFLVFVLNWNLLYINLSDVCFPVSSEGLSPNKKLFNICCWTLDISTDMIALYLAPIL